MTTNTNNENGGGNVDNGRDIAAELAAATIGCTIGFTWLGVSKRVDDNKQAEAAAVFGASAEAVKLSKSLIDTNNAKWKALTSIRSRIKTYWKDSTLPHTETKTRLLKRDNVDGFADTMRAFQTELAEAVADLDAELDSLKAEARRRLGNLYNAADYPATLRDVFSVSFSFPNLTPPDYLRQLSPELYRRESERVARQFAEAAELAGTAFLTELAKLVERITETLETPENGRRRVFRNSMIDNLTAFFERFKALNITGSAELAALVERAQQAVSGIDAQALRDSSELSERLRGSMLSIGEQLDAELETLPARRIRFTPAAEPSAEAEAAATGTPAEPSAEADTTPQQTGTVNVGGVALEF